MPSPEHDRDWKHDSDHHHDHDHGRARGAASLAHSGGRVLVVVLLLLVAGLAGARTFFFVDETQYVYVTQFGEPVRLCTEAGLGVKWPYQSVWRFDRRLEILAPPPREMLTEDKENLNVGWYVCWRLPRREFVVERLSREGDASPPSEAAVRDRTEVYVGRFLRSVGTIETANNRLEERVQAAIAAGIGRARLPQLVSLDPAQIQLEQIMTGVVAPVRQAAAEQFGIEVVEIRLTRFNYPEAVKPAVFAEIRSERQRVAVQYRAEGASQKTRIESRAMLQRDQLLAQADREAARIRGEGEARSMEILNAAHGQDPEFYELLKTLETYRTILDERTTIVLSAASPLLKLLTEGLPPLTNASPPSSGGAPVARQSGSDAGRSPEDADGVESAAPPSDQEPGP